MKAMERLGRNEINFSIKSRMMDMRKAVNHPYLIDYPVMEDGMYFRYLQQQPGQKLITHSVMFLYLFFGLELQAL
jgi:hypothetical protein